MQLIKFMLIAAGLLVWAGQTTAQTPAMVKKTATTAAKTETFQVLGNCGMCEKTIEKAAKAAGADQADWNSETRQVTVTYNPARTSTDVIQRSIAEAGYDNAGYRAPDGVYDKLHACCHYDRSGAPSTAKSCEAGATGAVETATFKVLGDCGMCEKTIVTAAKQAGATEASWDMDTHVMVVKFPADATSVAKIQRAIAEKGYDTPSLKATDTAYKALPSCCQYDRREKLD